MVLVLQGIRGQGERSTSRRPPALVDPFGDQQFGAIQLPVVEREQWSLVEKAVETDRLDASLTSGKRVLVVDDEKSVRDALSDILSKDGFSVDSAREGQEALEMMENRGYSLIITDVKMPGLSGMDLYRHAMERHRYLKGRIIMLTGDVFSEDIKEFFSETGVPNILKPFEMGELKDLIKDVLS